MSQGKGKSADVELAKFIASLIIMYYHLCIMELSGSYFKSAGVFVEFFLMITGYYTAKHFDGKKDNNTIKTSILYTINKYVRFLPYTIIVTVLAYITEQMNNLFFNKMSFKSIFYGFQENFLFDILLLSNDRPLVAPLWYLSATFVVFPIIVLIAQISNRYWIVFLSFLYTYFYYGIVGYTSNSWFPGTVPRVLGGLLLGFFIYECTYLLSDILQKSNRFVLTLVEVFAFFYVVIATFCNLENYKFIILMFTICLFIMLPNLSYTNILGGKIIIYLGKLSMPLFIFHWYIGTIVRKVNKIFMLGDKISILLYYALTIVVSIIIMYFVDHWKWFQEKIKNKIELKD